MVNLGGVEGGELVAFIAHVPGLSLELPIRGAICDTASGNAAYHSKYIYLSCQQNSSMLIYNYNHDLKATVINWNKNQCPLS